MTVAITTKHTERSLSTIEYFLSNRMEPDEASDFVTNLLIQATDSIESNPLQYPLNQDALAYGAQVHNWFDPTGKYVCCYRYDQPKDTAVIYIIASTRQDWKSALYVALMS